MRLEERANGLRCSSLVKLEATIRTQSGYYGYTTISAPQLDNETMPYKHTPAHTHTQLHTHTCCAQTPFLQVSQVFDEEKFSATARQTDKHTKYKILNRYDK